MIGFRSFMQRNISPLPSFLSVGQIRNDDRRKEYNLTLSEESGSGYRKTHLNLATSAQILTAPVGRVWRLTHSCSVASLLEKRFACHHSAPYFFISLFPIPFYHRSRMTGRYLIPLCIKSAFYVSAQTCPFRQLRWHLPRQAGTAYGLHFIVLWQQSSNTF